VKKERPDPGCPAATTDGGQFLQPAERAPDERHGEYGGEKKEVPRCEDIRQTRAIDERPEHLSVAVRVRVRRQVLTDRHAKERHDGQDRENPHRARHRGKPPAELLQEDGRYDHGRQH
jgi:hypothetical protein